MLEVYYRLTKPGIIYGNALTATAGFLFAAKWHVHFWLLLATITGMCLVIAAACVFNNCIDRDIDKSMARTKKRALVTGAVSLRNALMFGVVLLAAGFTTLVLFTNKLVLLIGIGAFLDYVVLYGWSKRRSVWGTVVGSISGAAPVAAGYIAVTDRIDMAAALLFLILVLWQMPHFYAIAMYRLEDYKAAQIPVLPAVRGLHATKVQILCYIAGFMAAVAALTLFGYAGYSFLVAMGALGAAWLWKGVRGFRAANDTAWGRSMFLFSLIIVLALSVALSVGSVLA
ncbi:MAG TPA: heme o synthase [Candidatus Saccharimonadales bacterium]|nr:heme o synthase [Candidatus Saccharimonadales bacterium]